MLMKKNTHAAKPHACQRVEGGSSSPLLDAKTWRRSRINLASPAPPSPSDGVPGERSIHLLTLIAACLAIVCATSFAQTAETVAEREVQRRQSAIPQGEAALIRAKAAMKAKNFTVAHEEFRTALVYLPDAVVSGKAHDEAVEGFCKSGVILAEARIAQADYAGAEAILNEILSDRYDSNCRPARELLTHLRQPGYFNKTMGPKFIAKVEEVKALLTEADGYYQSGRYDLAFKRYDQVLNLDPYNTAARRGQEKINNMKNRYGEEAYNETRSRQLWQVEKGWEEPVRKYGQTAGAVVNAFARDASGTARITNKLSRERSFPRRKKRRRYCVAHDAAWTSCSSTGSGSTRGRAACRRRFSGCRCRACWRPRRRNHARYRGSDCRSSSGCRGSDFSSRSAHHHYAQSNPAR